MIDSVSLRPVLSGFDWFSVLVHGLSVGRVG